jgi:hypothetical protein
VWYIFNGASARWKLNDLQCLRFRLALAAMIQYFRGVAGPRLRWLVYALVISAENAIAGTAPVAQSDQHTNGRYLGAISCSSSSCHGGAGDQHNQFIIWSQRDFHRRASLILTNARSARIAETLHIDDAAAGARCTICHSPLKAIAPARLVDRSERDSGVSCESCHGPAEAWLRSHTRRDYTYPMRVSAGMHDLRSFYVRANTCVACHQTLDSDIIAAGHPRLVFELYTQTKTEPPHWCDPLDSPVKSWLTGQAVALRELTWKANRAAQQSDPDAAAQTSALIWLLSRVTSLDQSLPPIADTVGSATVQHAADELARHVSGRRFEHEYSTKLLQTLTSNASEFQITSFVPSDVVFYRAKRLALACEALSGSASSAQPGSAEFNRIINDVSSPANFNASAFAEHVAAWRVATGVIDRSGDGAPK